jgi:hypothetical protein
MAAASHTWGTLKMPWSTPRSMMVGFSLPPQLEHRRAELAREHVQFGIAHHGQHRELGVELHMGAHEGDDLLARVGQAGQQRIADLAEVFLVADAAQVQQNVFLGREVRVQRGRLYAGGQGDVTDRGAAEAAFRDQPQGRVENDSARAARRHGRGEQAVLGGQAAVGGESGHMNVR